jgi:hypothetical protein
MPVPQNQDLDASGVVSPAARPGRNPGVVLVRGAYAGGSSWSEVDRAAAARGADRHRRAEPPDVAARQAASWPTSASRQGAGRYASDRPDVLRLRSLLPLGGVEFDLLILSQRPVAGTRDRGEVDEHVRRPVIGGDETKALISVEPLHCSRCHQFRSFIRHATTRRRRADREPTGLRLRNRTPTPGHGLPQPPRRPYQNR